MLDVFIIKFCAGAHFLCTRILLTLVLRTIFFQRCLTPHGAKLGNGDRF